MCFRWRKIHESGDKTNTVGSSFPGRMMTEESCYVWPRRYLLGLTKLPARQNHQNGCIYTTIKTRRFLLTFQCSAGSYTSTTGKRDEKSKSKNTPLDYVFFLRLPKFHQLFCSVNEKFGEIPVFRHMTLLASALTHAVHAGYRRVAHAYVSPENRYEQASTVFMDFSSSVVGWRKNSMVCQNRLLDVYIGLKSHSNLFFS